MARMDALCIKCNHWVTLWGDFSKISTHPTAPMLRDVCEGTGGRAVVTRMVATGDHPSMQGPVKAAGPGDRNDHDE